MGFLEFHCRALASPFPPWPSPVPAPNVHGQCCRHWWGLKHGHTLLVAAAIDSESHFRRADLSRNSWKSQLPSQKWIFAYRKPWLMMCAVSFLLQQKGPKSQPMSRQCSTLKDTNAMVDLSFEFLLCLKAKLQLSKDRYLRSFRERCPRGAEDGPIENNLSGGVSLSPPRDAIFCASRWPGFTIIPDWAVIL